MEKDIDSLVTHITQVVFKEKPIVIEPILEKGIVNLVFKIQLQQNVYILRMQKDENALKAYQKEKWCMEQMVKLHIPSPQCVALGIEHGYSYAFQTYIEGVNGKEMPSEKERIWFTLGQYAKKFHSISAPEYALNLPWLNEYLFEEGFLSRNNLISVEKLEHIQKRVNEMERWNYEPMLIHGNLHPNNTIVDSTGIIYLIDWGTAGGGRVPYGDVAELYTWNIGKENINAFLKGYGMSESELPAMMHDIQTLVLVRLLTTLRWKMERKENWKEDEFINSTIIALKDIKDFSEDILFTKNT